MAPKKTGASLNRGGSKQTRRTPRIFLDACEARFGKITFDLAAHSRNCVVPRFFSKKQDSLRQNWSKLAGEVCWLNPPFADIPSWAKKCALTVAATPGLKILFLVPASVGSEWFYHHVYAQALVLPLRQRIVFVGETHGFPKDLMLIAYGVGETGFQPWRWKQPWVRPALELAAE
ncbi:MAG TPA: DNA N-6-adenine-methyltransferase [Polyangiaceae bacterium]|nr:DNA N-6-adenine-methyltransferase [Polyangiaceae bacterium]